MIIKKKSGSKSSEKRKKSITKEPTVETTTEATTAETTIEALTTETTAQSPLPFNPLKKGKIKITAGEQLEEIEKNTNLKRRRDSCET